jgi:hypothetical protein
MNRDSEGNVVNVKSALLVAVLATMASRPGSSSRSRPALILYEYGLFFPQRQQRGLRAGR